MLELDSLVLDVMFAADDLPSADTLIEALGGEEVAKARQLFDPDANDPRIEMQLSPSVPFRRRGERRIMIIDASVAPMREDPRADPIIPIDLREEKERLIELVDKCNARMGRIMALGTWGEAVLVARSARDLRAVALMSWVLDPTVDVEGRKRAQPLGQKDIEEKLLAYDKRLDELNENQILASIGPAKLERRGDLLVLDVLEPDGTWDLRKSFAMELALQQVDNFSLIIGAPQDGAPRDEPAPAPEKPTPEKPAPEAATAPAEPKGSPLRFADRDGRVVFVFPADRWDRDVAAALGKRDWDSILRSGDEVPGQIWDRIRNDGAGFIAPLEFLSEVFIDGKPLSRPQFDEAATAHDGGVRSLPVHCPRYGSALLLDTKSGRFITSEVDAGASILELVG